MAGPRFVQPTFRSPAWWATEHPPAYPIVEWERGDDGIVTDENPSTATFISSGGIFVTARHVVELAIDRRRLHVLFHNGARLTPSKPQFELHPESDIAVGYAPLPDWLDLKCFWLATKRLEVDDEVWTFGYGEYALGEDRDPTHDTSALTLNLAPAIRKGAVLDVLPGGTPQARGLVYVHSTDTPGGNSGGPLLRVDPGGAPPRAVYGIMSKGIRGDSTNDDYSLSTSIEAALDLPLAFAEGQPRGPRCRPARPLAHRPSLPQATAR